jgi:RNA polymerase-binding transcription factor DksA
MADDIDLANDLIDIERSRALSKIRQSTASAEASGSKFCVECGDNMPVGRTKLGYKLCVPCAEYAERKKSMYFED